VFAGNPLKEPQKSEATSGFLAHSPLLLEYLRSESSKHGEVNSKVNPTVESKSVKIPSLTQSVCIECDCLLIFSSLTIPYRHLSLLLLLPLLL